MSTEQYLLSNLHTALKSNEPERVQRALTSYLKGGSSSAIPAPAPVSVPATPTANIICVPGAPAEACANIIDQCLRGSSGDCSEQFAELSGKINILLDFTHISKDDIRKLLENLTINFTETNAVSEWMKRIKARDSAVAAKIETNQNLMRVLKAFVIKANKPSATNNEIEKELNGPCILPFKTSGQKIIKSCEDIPVRVSRDSLQKGGGSEQQPKDTYTRYMDGIRQILQMVGGGDVTGADTYAHFKSMYDSFVELLRAKGKQIQPDDKSQIEALLETLKNTEEQLNKINGYMMRYRDISRKVEYEPSNPQYNELRDLLKRDTIALATMEELKQKYEEVKKSYVAKADNLTSILEALQKALAIGPTGMPERNEAIKKVAEQMKTLNRN